MTQNHTEHLLEQLAQTLPEGSVSLDIMLTEAKAARRRRTRRTLLAVTGVAVAAVVVGVGVPVALGRDEGGREVQVATDDVSLSSPTLSSVPAATPGGARLSGLTPQQRASAKTVLSDYATEHPDDRVDSAWARWERGTVKQPNVGECTSGELLRVSLFGSFATVVTGLPQSANIDPDPLAGTVTEVRLVADALTEEVCQLSVVTGTHDPDPRDEQIYPESER